MFQTSLKTTMFLIFAYGFGSLGCDGESKKQLELAKKRKCEVAVAVSALAKAQQAAKADASPQNTKKALDAKEQLLRLNRYLKTHCEQAGDFGACIKEVEAHSCPSK